MAKKIHIEKDGETLFKGNILNIPVHKDDIIASSIELFDDDDPCIIHTSYVVKQFAETLSDLLENSENKSIQVNDYIDQLSFLNIDAGATIKKLK